MVCTYEGLGDDDEGVQLEGKERTFKTNWREDAGGYLRGVRGCGSSATEKRERQRKRELEKSASQTRSIVKMFSAQFNKNKSNNTKPHIIFFCAQKCPKRGVEKGEVKVELRTQAVKDLEEFLRRKTEQINIYGHILAPKSSYYHNK